jgi:hypothetical protein
MATKTTADPNFYETWVDSQKKMIDNMTESASKFTKDTEVAETLHKGSDLYKNWLDNQLSFLNEQTEKMKASKSGYTPEQISATTKEWMDNQMKMTREFMDFSMNTMKTYFESALKSFPMLNGNAEKMKAAFNENMNLYHQWNETLNKSYEEMMKHMQPGTVKDAMSGMSNMADTYGKFVELWAPFVKSLQEKTFSAELFKSMMNPTAYKEMFDKMFHFSSNPFSSWSNNWNTMWNNGMNTADWMKNWTNMMNPSSNPFSQWMNPSSNPFSSWMNNTPFSQWTNLFQAPSNPMNEWMKLFGMQSNPYQEWMKQWNSAFGNNAWNNFSMPDGSMFFNNLMNNYNTMYTSTQEMFAPMFRMMTPSQAKQNLDAWNSLVNKMIQYNMKSSELQYLSYTTGMKAMQKVAERMQEKLSKGEEFKGMTALYSEWLNTSDKVFVDMFESPAYSKVQGEVAALQHHIKKEGEAMMEKMMAYIPVITRSEMDDNYKTIHDLKKRVSELEKALEAKEAPVKKAAK